MDRPVGAMRKDYAAFLLRMWRQDTHGSVRWRTVLQNAHSGEFLHFASLEALCRHLRVEYAETTECDEAAPPMTAAGPTTNKSAPDE